MSCDLKAAKPPQSRQLAVVGAASLLLFGAAGWILGALRRQEPAEPVPSAPAPLAAREPIPRGRLVFLAHCARCHGPDGRGDGPDASALRPPPRDLTAAAWRTPVSSESLRKVIRDGLPGTMMIGQAAALSSAELDAVVDYVMSLAPKDAGRARALEPLLQAAGFEPAASAHRAPPLEVRDTDGQPITLETLRGKFVVLVFWGTSCVPCIKELPEVAQFAAHGRGRDLAVLAVCADETDPAVVRSVAAQRAPGLTVYVDPTGAAKIAYDVQALPSAALIGPDGILLGTAQGSLRWSSPEMEALIRSCQPAAKGS